MTRPDPVTRARQRLRANTGILDNTGKAWMTWRCVAQKEWERAGRLVRYRSADDRWDITAGHVNGEVPTSTNYFYFVYCDGQFAEKYRLLKQAKLHPRP